MNTQYRLNPELNTAVTNERTKINTLIITLNTLESRLQIKEPNSHKESVNPKMKARLKKESMKPDNITAKF